MNFIKKGVSLFVFVSLFLGTVLLGIRLSMPVKQVKAETVPVKMEQVNQEEIQAELNFSEIDVVNVLEKQILEYQSMMKQGDNDFWRISVTNNTDYLRS